MFITSVAVGTPARLYVSVAVPANVRRLARVQGEFQQ